MTRTAVDLVTLLHQRGPLLARVVEAPADASTLTEEMAVSRSTINRILTEFDEWGLLVSDADQFEPTLLGRLVLTAYEDFEVEIAAMSADESGDAPRWHTTDDHEVLGLVADRLDVLEYVQTPRDKRTLVGELPYARSTVDWIIRELEVVELIQRTADGYTITRIGQQLVAGYRTLVATLADLLAAQDLLAILPADCALPPALFAEADVERPEEATPFRLLTGLRERLDTADRIRAVLPALPNPQLLDACHHQVVRHGASLELITSPVLATMLTSEFPGLLAEMAAAAAGSFSAFTTDVPPFGILLVDTAAGTTVSVIVYTDQQLVDGAIHTETDPVIAWAEDYYESIHDQATETTSDWLDAAPPMGDVALSAVTDPGRVEREAEGFVQLTPEYFTERAPAPPLTAWRVGLELVDVHAGYAIDRQIESDSNVTLQSLTDVLVTRLADGDNHAVIGAPGSGKSTVCKSVACQWYEQGRGTVFYRESGTGTTFDAAALLSAQLRAAEGQTLVVVEDAVRAEANTIFRVMRDFREDPTVTFLLDAREGEWQEPKTFPTDARLDAYRTEAIETISIPALDESEAERLITHFEDTVGHNVDLTASHLLRGIRTKTDPQEHQASRPAELLLLSHRLTLHANPLASEDTRISTTLVEDVQQSYEELRATGDVALTVGILVNLLNATGIGVHPALVYALADGKVDDESGGETFDAVHDALSSLTGQIIFEREGVTGGAQYRAVHEAWSSLFLDQLLATDKNEANRQFGRCVTALLSLADDPTQRARLSAAVGDNPPVIDRIENAPGEWADAITERIFHLGLNRPGLAPLFGTTKSATIALPAACSPELEPRCATWRGRMYVDSGHLDRATQEFEHAIDLIDDTDDELTEQTIQVKAQSHKDRASVAWRRGELDIAAEFLGDALDSYRDIDDRLGETNCYSNLGVLALDRSDLDRAAAYCERALDNYREIGALGKYRAKNLNHLGLIAFLRGDLDHAEAYFEQSIDIGREIDGYFDQTLAVSNRGEISQLRGNLDSAEEYYKRGIDIARNAGFPPGIAHGLLGLGKVAIDREDLEMATEYIERSLDISHEIDNMRAKVRGYRYLGTIAHKRNTLAAAEEHLKDALDCCDGDRYRYDKAKALVELGELALTREIPVNARQHFEDAVDLFREMGAVRDAVDSLKRLAKTCERLDDTRTAITHYETAVALAREAEFDVPHAAVTEQRTQLIDEIPRDGG